MDLTTSLVQWLNTFDLSSKCRSVDQLCDGVIISHVLNQICPEYFKTELLNKIETDCGTNWRLRVSNLRKVYEAIVDYYSEVLDKPIDDKLLPDVTLIGRDYDVNQLTLLLQLIVGCAINCDRKDYFIAIMTNLPLDVQHGIKTAIQQLETFDESLGGFESTNISNQISIDAKESVLQRCAELEAEVKKLNNEKTLFQMENEKLSEKLKTFQTSDRNNGNNDSIDNEAVFQRLNHQIIGLQSELSKTEELKEDYRMNAELREREVSRLNQQLDQLNSKLGDLKQDRDELDRLRYLSEELERYKAKEDVYKSKIEELKETKRKLQITEERNEKLMQKICELEEETKKLSSFKNQIDLYKKQKEELRLKVGEESYRADRADEEIKRVTKKFEEIIQEKDKYMIELNDLRLELSRHKGVNNVMSLDVEYTHPIQPVEHTVEMMQKSDTQMIQMREKLTRLEFENLRLKENHKISDDQHINLLESQLDDEKTKLNDLEATNRHLKQKLMELEANHSQSNHASDDEQMQTFQDIIKQNEISLESTKQELIDAQQEIDSLKEVIVNKDKELNDKDEQYKKYVDKAKLTLDSLSQQSLGSNTSINSSASDCNNDANYWKHIVQQKELEISKIKSDCEESDSFREMESKLLTISFHNLSSHLQRKSAEDRIRNGSLNSGHNSVSFLARQRQATTRKYNTPTVSQSDFYD
ncbi:protein Hook homolog 3-like isoform X2 [Oppia nitens]|uniref:protein Hook homolog 3-like isoform X2 n=1 Tax=Oppia nitens TaxID=1686743 RepID=UPI0023DA442B|nr:protein Hook homolog 3-like isoform X2 [Oppia nitens]